MQYSLELIAPNAGTNGSVVVQKVGHSNSSRLRPVAVCFMTLNTALSVSRGHTQRDCMWGWTSQGML